MTNRLAQESSPYLQQHQDNPVDWYPWGEEALAAARTQQKPIFLSIGYSACHWCHVMEHESFEDEALAAELNKRFICIKVDREERPDLDQIYMQAVQMLTGRGGWPMSMFLTPDLKPFYGGTYWPPTASRGMPGFDQVIQAVSDAWNNKRDELVAQSAELTGRIQQMATPESTDGQIDISLFRSAAANLERAFDFTHGGFGRAPKFPHAMDLQLLLRIWRRTRRSGLLEMVQLNLDKMAQGGIYDHLAGGFARYSVDERWLVPHFEKMLYDNALLTGAYLDALLVTGEHRYGQIARETLDYILRTMTDAESGFHSTEDADSEGEEGKFYLWTVEQVKSVLGDELGDRFCYVYDVTEDGNFEGKNILNLPKSIEQCASLRGWDEARLKSDLQTAREQLRAARDQRIRPGKDDKIIVSWNGLMIDSMARGAGILQQPTYLDAAIRAASFVLEQMTRDDGRLLHTWRHGTAKLDAYLDDYTCFINALITIYENSFDERWIDEAVRLADLVLKHFHDPKAGSFYFTADDHEELIARQKDFQDGSVPSGNSMVATALLRLGTLCGRRDYLEAAEGCLRTALSWMQQSPTAMGQMLIAADMFVGPMYEIVILGNPDEEPTGRALAELRRRFIPNRVAACRRQPQAPGGSRHLDAMFQGKQAVDSGPAVFVCRQFQCQAPVHGKQPALETWEKLASERDAD